MKKEVSHISVFQTAKVLAVLTAVTTAIFLIPLGILMLAFDEPKNGWFLIIYPLILLIIGFIANSIVYGLYNVIARFTGGIRFTLKDVE